ncbi:Cue2p Ecym_2432 [Eremothecium cymbalariae DBVPG|uniref:Smr domain-containing protein n=1 Tax=Eremothecium cymbalariae (strain CBS 270.75 / DBVPG 7215 / KCTC 17166 / NRRL Y-17582) TaxID=931890 RepID=G8JPA4_ERECY|nr:Hypothetical protein Ecym_2432 [Eremothecium cymbalariae DBVPG\
MDCKRSIDLLQELFPHETTQTLESALEGAEGDLNIACAILINSEEDVKREEKDDILTVSPISCIETLIDMFPSLSADDVERIYEEYGNDVDKCINTLLTFEGLTNEDIEAQKEYEKVRSLKDTDKVNKKDAWGSLSQKVDTIKTFTGVIEGIAKAALFKNSFHTTKSIISIIYDWEDEYKTIDSNPNSTVTPQAQIMGAGGKVQSAYGFAHSKSYNYPRSKSAGNESDKQESFSSHQRPYRYNSQNKEARELENILRTNLQFKSIRRKFFESALEFFNGDIDKTLAVAVFILETNGGSLTHPRKEFKQDSLQLNTMLTKKSGIIRNKRSANVNFTPDMFSSDSIFAKSKEFFNRIISQPRVDLHGFTSNDAEVLIQPCLEKWWHREIELREQNCQNLRNQSCLNVPDVVIVTGRGLHSLDGVPRVRIKVQQILDKLNYIYTEEPSFFVIRGRKPTRTICSP